MTSSRRNADPLVPVVDPAVRSAPTWRRTVRVLMLGVILAVFALAALGTGSAPVAAGPATGTRTARVHAANELETSSTSTTLDDGITQNPLGEPLDEEGSSAAEDRKIWAVVAGLVLVAIALTALTVRYWRQTRPVPSRPSKRSRGRRARTDDEPADDGDLGSDIFVDDPRPADG